MEERVGDGQGCPGGDRLVPGDADPSILRELQRPRATGCDQGVRTVVTSRGTDVVWGAVPLGVECDCHARNRDPLLLAGQRMRTVCVDDPTGDRAPRVGQRDREDHIDRYLVGFRGIRQEHDGAAVLAGGEARVADRHRHGLAAASCDAIRRRGFAEPRNVREEPRTDPERQVLPQLDAVGDAVVVEVGAVLGVKEALERSGFAVGDDERRLAGVRTGGGVAGDQFAVAECVALLAVDAETDVVELCWARERPQGR